MLPIHHHHHQNSNPIKKGKVNNIGKSSAEWRSRSIYQIITDRFSPSESGSGKSCPLLYTYCGGTFQGITSHLNYVKSLGFNAIWISPIVLNLPGGYHGYWAQDWFAVNPHFGTQADLINLVKTAHSMDIWVMVDVVFNHVGPVGFDFSEISPFNSSTHYHPYCQINNWSNQTEVEYCRLADLPDLDQSNNFVYKTLSNWITDFVLNTFGFDGIRIDTVPEISKTFWSDLKTNILAPKYGDIYSIGEVLNGDMNYVAPYANILGATLHYPMYFVLKSIFSQGGSMYQIRNTINSARSLVKDTSLLGVFIDNHDNPRFLNYESDYKLYQNALTYVLTSEGIPIFYYGTEQGFNGGADPFNREPLWPTSFNQNSYLFTFVQKIMNFRNTHFQEFLNNPLQVERYVANNFYAFSRGNVFVATTNVGSSYGRLQYTITYHPYSDGTVLCDIFWGNNDCETVTNGQFTVVLLNGESKIYYPQQ
ncbi:predicted protein [Naegleria gruberi]|uniref:alpha-amylase n=1 Tax=Naegleria gruberi TaxID=5762 RepID=D2VHQ3_NAEGR|nr:uncharacterized protein NAEGRDRAFT_34178 [Naegleria gruberi]EFC43633.1 predicted protein [Naegleria gruberi]|eukprot:XP_002676377.1 predicted protein [Naegleria gruberi strain NEG-M]